MEPGENMKKQPDYHVEDYPNHCDECGAWLADQRDITTHGEWHRALTALLGAVEETANHADAFHRLYKGKPA